jgi:hypothetical protein
VPCWRLLWPAVLATARADRLESCCLRLEASAPPLLSAGKSSALPSRNRATRCARSVCLRIFTLIFLSPIGEGRNARVSPSGEPKVLRFTDRGKPAPPCRARIILPPAPRARKFLPHAAADTYTAPAYTFTCAATPTRPRSTSL